MGLSADGIAAEYDLTLANIHAALAYYFDHRAEIDQAIEDSQAFAQALRDRTPSKVQQRLTESLADGTTG
jgi:hypothetical protein